VLKSFFQVIAPDAHIHVNSPLVDKFAAKFPGMSLFEVISDFSLPTSIGHLTTPLQHPTRQGRLAQMVLWLLQHFLLMQLHVYVQFMPAHDENDDMPLDLSAEDGSAPAENGNDEDENQCSTISINLNGHENSLPSTSSQPLAVPNTKNSYSEYSDSVITSNILYNSVTQAGSSHKSMYSITQTSISTDDNDSTVSVEDEDKIKELLSVFDEMDRACVAKVPAASNAEDLSLMVKLWQAGKRMDFTDLRSYLH
jgi:nitrogen permease regulator 3-like protein